MTAREDTRRRADGARRPVPRHAGRPAGSAGRRPPARRAHHGGPRRRLVGVALVLAFLAGMALLLYPTVSELWNRRVQSRLVASYAEATEGLDEPRREGLLAEARAYNEALLSQADRFHPTDAFHRRYERALDVTGDGIMCTLEIPSLDIELPVYHGIGADVLQVGVGHVEGSSLPVGGAGTHAVLSGHRGLPSARLLTDIDQLSEGDRFLVNTLGETLTYEVDQVLTVEPHETDAIAPEDDKDLCTLVTCTPYGVNTHRLLVRGHRVPTVAAAEGDVGSGGAGPDLAVLLPVAGTALLAAVFARALLGGRGRRAVRPAHDARPSRPSRPTARPHGPRPSPSSRTTRPRKER